MVFDAPLQGLYVGVKEYVEAVSLDGAAVVEDLDGPAIVVAGDDHLSAEGVALVGGYERIARLYLVSGGGYAVGVLAAAFRARVL